MKECASVTSFRSFETSRGQRLFEQNNLNKAHLLIVDDDIGILTILADVLQRWGYHVACCTNAAEALERLGEQQYDLLISDLVMPDTDGIQVLNKARFIDPDLMCIIMTGHGTIQTAVDAMKIGAFDYIIKPLDFKMLKNIVARACEVHGMLKLKEIYRSIIEDHQKEIICRFLTDGTLTFMNEAFCRYFDRTKEQLLGRNFIEFIDDAKREDVANALSSISPANPIVTIDLPFNQRPGLIQHQRWIIKGIFFGNDHHRENQAVGIDITEQKRAEESLQELFMGLVRAMVNALDAKSQWTRGHSERVALYTEEIAKKLGIEENELKNLRLASLLHDIGKIGTYDYLLDKPTKLTPEEYEIVKKHPIQGAKILQEIHQLKDIIPLIRHHHERIDGMGYPDGLSGDSIPLGARIIHIADSFDAMTADRPYRSGLSREHTMAELLRCSGTQFDSKILEVFLKVLNEL
jgi:putative nucleotidyltransferase with HDIG domain/PAS domain S-box-containing protein